MESISSQKPWEAEGVSRATWYRKRTKGFPGFVLMHDRKTIMKCGKRYHSTKAMVADMSMPERRATLRWYPRRYSWATDYRLDHRHRTLYYGVYDPDSKWLKEKDGNAA
jgi:hypothetical protein